MNQELANRLGVLITIVSKTPSKHLGRTAIMKLAYFLGALRDVPLGYRFTLYAYGPFDSSVLQDVEMASNVGALRSTPVSYPTGSGYDISPGPYSANIEAPAKEFVSKYSDDIDWVVNEFGGLSAAELELASTIIYIDQEVGGRIEPEDLARRVNEVKPHFRLDKILRRIEELETKALLQSV
jgi:uncharacterized protein YwgA